MIKGAPRVPFIFLCSYEDVEVTARLYEYDRLISSCYQSFVEGSQCSSYYGVDAVCVSGFAAIRDDNDPEFFFRLKEHRTKQAVSGSGVTRHCFAGHQVVFVHYGKAVAFVFR